MTDKETRERRKRLKEYQTQWMNLYSGRMPDPGRMKSKGFARELFLLSELVGTVFMTARMYARWRKMDEERTRRALGFAVW